MASRLSDDSLEAVYETGHQGFHIVPESPLDLIAPPAINLNALVAQEDAETKIQALPPQALYHALIKRGLEDSLDVLPLLSSEQWLRIFDYDVWSEDRLSRYKAIKWLSLYRELGDEEFAKRFRQLDQEYQLALLSALVVLYDEEEYESLSQMEQDALSRLPCGTLHYRVTSDDPKVQDFVDTLVQASLATDVNYTYSFLAHAAYLPPNEQEALAAQFRRARLEEDGFISYSESLTVFRPLDLERWRAKWMSKQASTVDWQQQDRLLPSLSATGPLFLSVVLHQAQENWDSKALEEVNRGFTFLGNTLCAAGKIEADDLSALRRMLEQAQALASLGLEYLASGHVDLGLEILRKEHPQVLFRAGLTLIGKLQAALITALEQSGLTGAAGLSRFWRQDKRGTLLHRLETQLGTGLGFNRIELLKGLLNRFPLRPLRTRLNSESAALNERVVYTPVASLAALRDLARAVDGIAGLLHLARLASAPASPLFDLDKHLLTAFARVLLGGEFRADPLTLAEIDELVQRPQTSVQHLTTEFFSGVEGSLRIALLEASDSGTENSWALSRHLDIATHDPLQQAMTDLSDLLMQLHEQREAARTGRPHGLLSLLFVSQA